MSRYGNPAFKHAESGSRVVSQYQRGNRGPAAHIPPSSFAGGAQYKPVAVTSADWTADTTGYPDAADLGNITLYRADVGHNLNNQFTKIVGLMDATGQDISERLQFRTNEDPSNPGNLHANSSRIWISADSAPSADLYVLCLG